MSDQQQRLQERDPADVIDSLSRRLEKRFQSEGRLRDLLEVAWGIIANAGGGNWQATQTAEWIGAAETWRDAYHDELGDWTAPHAE